jgi:hypothetical protein
MFSTGCQNLGRSTGLDDINYAGKPKPNFHYLLAEGKISRIIGGT